METVQGTEILTNKNRVNAQGSAGVCAQGWRTLQAFHMTHSTPLQ